MAKNARICTISLDSRLMRERSMDVVFDDIENNINIGAVDEPDLFLLPEACLSGLAEDQLCDNCWFLQPGDKYWSKFSNLAKTYNAYVAASVLTLREGCRYNSVIVFDRAGEHVYCYDKAYLTRPELECGLTAGGREPDCFQADFGRVAFAICFDLNFRGLFEQYHKKGMELLLFPSYFPGGRILSNLAFDFSCSAVSSHAQGYESVFIDNYGREVARANMFVPALTRQVILNSAVLHLSGNYDKISAIKKAYGAAVDIEVHRPEALMIISSSSHDISVDNIIKEFKLKALGAVKK